MDRHTPSFPADDRHPLDWLWVIVKRKYAVMAALVAGALLAAVYAFTEIPLYEGRVQLLIDAEDPNVVSFAQVVDEGQTRQDYYQTQYRLIRSRSVARTTVEKLQLWNDPELTGRTASRLSASAVARQALSTVASYFPKDSPASADPDRATTALEAGIINRLLSHVTVTPVRGSRLVEVRYRSEDPEMAASVANTVAAIYIEQNVAFRFTTTHEASSWLERQLNQQRQAVATAESRLQRFREQNAEMSFDQSENIVVQKLTELNGAVTRARIERMQKEAQYQQLMEIQDRPEALETFPEILSNASIQEQRAALGQLQREMAQLTRRYGERHPNIIRIDTAIEAAEARIRGEVGEVVQGLGIEYQTALAQENTLASALDAQRNAALAMNRKAIDYGVLERDVLSSRQIYEALLKRTQEIGISGDLRTSNVRVVDSAEVPMSPISPRVPLTAAVGVFGGLLLGVAFAFLLECIDNRVTTPEELERDFGLPSLGLIPLAAGTTKKSGPLLGQGAPPDFSEAFRTLRTNVLFSNTEDGCLSIVVTSTGVGEGKTLVASNLAVGMAQADRRVLIIDTDMRRPRIHEVFGLPAEPGLSNVLVGAAGIDTATQVVSGKANLWVLPAGKTPPNPAELLASSRFAELLGEMSQRFDLIVLDTSPVMAVTDPAIVAHRAAGVLYVVAADRTSRYAARRALHQLGHARVRFIGAVLNRIDLRRRRYYYSRYYRKEYSRYYGVAQ